jgi:uncharacterized spore protein YtfJ
MYTRVTDKSANANNGYLIAGAGTNTATTTTVGKLGQALDFDGTDDYVIVPSITDPSSSSSRTYTAWIKPRTLGGASGGTIFEECNVSDCSGNNIRLLHLTSSNKLSSKVGNNVSECSSASNAITLNEWNFVTFTNVGVGTGNLYVNGILSGTANQSCGGGWFGSESMFIGATTTTSMAFDGVIDDARIYTRVLSAAEILQLYNVGKAKISRSSGTPQNLVGSLYAYYPFDGKDVYTRVSDKSGNGNNAYLIAGAGTNTATTTTVGKIGQALDFDGTDDYTTTLTGISAGTASLTSYTAWIKPRSLGGASGGTIIEECSASDCSGTNIRLFHLASSNKLAAKIVNNTTECVTSSNAIALNEWNFVGFTDDGSGNFYINGVATGTPNQSCGSAWTGTETLFVGATTTSSMAFDGSIDEVRVYNKILSASEILQLYNAGKAKVKSR